MTTVTGSHLIVGSFVINEEGRLRLVLDVADVSAFRRNLLMKGHSERGRRARSGLVRGKRLCRPAASSTHLVLLLWLAILAGCVVWVAGNLLLELLRKVLLDHAGTCDPDAAARPAPYERVPTAESRVPAAAEDAGASPPTVQAQASLAPNRKRENRNEKGKRPRV